MDPQAAIRLLTVLKVELDPHGNLARDDASLTSWRSRVRTVLTRSLGASNDVLRQFDGTLFTPGVYGDYPESEMIEARRSGAKTARALIDAAIYELNLIAPTSSGASTADDYDPGLWAHVGSLIEGEKWALVPAAVAIYVEDRVRTWSGQPAKVVGKQLYINALDPAGVLALGGTGTPGEGEGWKYLGMGFAQALGNADRHRLTQRSDLRRYALGVLGLGSLLLTQMHWEHPQEISNVEDR